MRPTRQIFEVSFAKWVHEHRIALSVSLILAFVQYFTFKALFPYPNLFPDSYSYLETAINHKPVSMWPIGYSRFLQYFSFVTRSHLALTLIQYIALQAAIFFLVYSVSVALPMNRTLFAIVLFSTVCNPLTYQVSNMVSSDALYTALSIIWFTQLIWLLNRPNMRLVLSHAFVLLCLFTMRYNALYYPVISISVLLWTNSKIKLKFVGIGCIVLSLCFFIGYTQYHYERATGQAQFSPFMGWQLASNALFAYAHVAPFQRIEPPLEYRPLQKIVNQSMDSLNQLTKRPDSKLGVYYLWDEHSPLKKRLHEAWAKDQHTDYFRRWAFMGENYKGYGEWIIQNYPWQFLRFYILPNFINYYSPNIEFLGEYNAGRDRIESAGTRWFHLKSNRIDNSTDGSLLVALNRSIVVALALVNLLFFLVAAGYASLRLFTAQPRIINGVLLLFAIVWCCNMGFSVVSSPVVLRYQIFPMLITQVFMIWLVSEIVKAGSTSQSSSALDKSFMLKSNEKTIAESQIR